MRRLILGLMVAGFAPAAYAADYGDILRGSEEYDPRPNYETYVPGHPNYFSWGGGYIGAQVGYGTASTNFELGDPANLWIVVGDASDRSFVWGAFAGYNVQWENAVLGIELGYNHTSLSATFVDPFGADSFALHDVGHLRGRMGWANGFYMPYVALGFAFARGDVDRTRVPPATRYVRDDAWFYGWTAGLGLDFALTANLFVRAEYEYMALRVSDTTTTLNTLRIGAGYRF